MSEQQPITWGAVIDYIRSAAGRLRAAEHGASEMLLLGPGDAAANQTAAFRRLVEGNRAAGSDLGWALERIEESAPPEPPARPLEAVLADIAAEGHRDVAVRRSVTLGYWLCETDSGAERWENGDMAAWNAWVARVERGVAEGDTAAAAAEARLAQIRTMRTAATPIHFEVEAGPACGTDEDQRLTSDRAAVTCPDCRSWLDLHAIAAEDRQRESEASEPERTPDEVGDLHDAGGEEGA